MTLWSSTFCLCLFMMSTLQRKKTLIMPCCYHLNFQDWGFVLHSNSQANPKQKNRAKHQINEDHIPLLPTTAEEIKYSCHFLKNIFTNSVSWLPCSPINLFGLFIKATKNYSVVNSLDTWFGTAKSDDFPLLQLHYTLNSACSSRLLFFWGFFLLICF